MREFLQFTPHHIGKEVNSVKTNVNLANTPLCLVKPRHRRMYLIEFTDLMPTPPQWFLVLEVQNNRDDQTTFRGSCVSDRCYVFLNCNVNVVKQLD